VGYVLAVIGGPAEELPPDLDAENETIIAAHSDRLLGITGHGTQGRPEAPADRTREAPRVRATPRARKLAREHGVDLEALAARLGGRTITANDVRDAIRK
jgi:pyruvate/2-oxoglutarate dehydrogenase complex dihydrolipoamide acyltransferase (E2) component